MKKFTLLIFVSLLSICGYAQLAPESFEDAWVGTPAAPPGWTVVNEQGPTVTWTQSNAGATLQPPNTGDHAAYLDRENVSPTSPLPKDWLITPYFPMPANGLLRFYSRLTSPLDQGGIYKVKISTDPDPTNLASYTDLQTWTELQINPVQTDYFEKVITLPAITGSVHIAFVMEGDNRDRWLIDDVKVVSQCFSPNNITALSPTLDSIDLDWVNNGGAVSWDIEIIPDYLAPTGVGQSYVGQPPFTKSDLLPDTAYKVYIRAVCSDQGTSEWVGPVFFTTAKEGEHCNYPIALLPPPYSVTDNTANFADNYEGTPGSSCGQNGFLSGNDVVYSYTPTANENININLSNTGNGAEMFIYEDCDDIGVTCIAGGIADATPIDIPSLAVTANNTIYIVISTNFAAQSTPYTLSVQKVNCDAPTGLSSSSPTGTTAGLSWNAGTATSWQFAVQTVGTGLPLGAGQNVTSNNITANQTFAGVAFTPATNYEYYVRADCGDGTYSIWAGPYIFATTQIPAQLNYAQDWETLPNGWSINNGTQVNKWMVGTATSNGGTHSLYVSNDNGLNNIYTTSASSVVHAFRDIEMPADVNQLNLAFDWKNIGENNWDYIRVFLTPVTFNPTPGQQIDENATNIKLAGDLSMGAAWSTFNGVVDASAYANTTMRLIFEWRNDGGGGSEPPAAVDNIKFSIITCPAPSDPEIAANSLTNSQVIINWTAPTPAPATGYEYYVDSSQTAPTDTTLPTGSATTTTATIPLTPSSSNYFWVRANCGPGDVSTWTGPLYFVAPQIPADMDYTQNFDDATHGWALNNGTQTNKWVVGSATSNSAANSLYISENNGTTNTFNVNSNSVVQAYRDIQMPATLDQIELSFDWKSVGDQWSDNFRVWLVPVDFTPTPGDQIFSDTDRIQIGDTFFQSSDWKHFSSIIQASGYAGSVRRLVFEWTNDSFGGTQAPAAIDNINLKVIPCPQPSDLQLSGLTQSVASFTWTPPVSAVAGYEYYLSTSATPPADTDAGIATANPTLSLLDLPTSTQHYIWVRSSCTATSKSYWIGPLAFITPQVPAVMDYVQNFDNGAHEWQIVNGTQANKWVVGTAASKSAPNSLYISNDNGVNNGYTIFSGSIVHAYRDITFPTAIDDAILSFDWRCMGQSFDDYFRVWIVPVDFSPTTGEQIFNGSGRQQLGIDYNNGSVWTTENITFNANAYQGQTRRIIFEWINSQWGGGEQPPAAIDNINLYKVTCPVPTNLALGSNTPAGTSFTWTPPSSVTPTFDYYYSTTATPPNATTEPSGNVNIPSMTLSGLPDSSNYYLWIRDNCGDSNSLWIGPLEFNTPQVPSPLDYNQNFDGNEYKWTIVNGNQTNKWVVGSATSNSPAKSLYISNTAGETYNYNTSNGSVVHAYKDFIIPAGTNPLDFSFDWKNKGDTFGDFIRVWRVPTTFVPTAGTQINGSADRVQIGNLLMNNGSWTNSSNILDPATYAGTNIRIVFEWVNNTFSGDQPPGAIDNIDFSVITCPKPVAQGVDLITQSGATFDWTETGSATAWEVYVAPAGQPSPTADTVGVDAPSNPFPYITPELTPSTNYVYYVRSVCDLTDKSKWAGPYAFRTAIANDECTGAYPIGVNPIDQDCAVSLTASYQGATPSVQPFECGGINGADIWYEFIATSDRANIELSEFVAIGSPSPVVIALYQGDQCGSLLQVDCSGTNVLAAKNLIVGTTYKVRLYINRTPADLNTSFKVCINTPQLPASQNQSACTVTTINYSFENPTPVPVVPPSPYPAMVNHNTVQGWRTTAADEIMEFWPTPNYENVPAFDGNQFVELNANLVSGLYQDYATPQTTTFTYSFAHRGRMGTDSCKLLAGPPGGPYDEVTSATTPNTGWQVYTGTYTTPATGQTTTRFIFQSTSTYNGDGSVGNFLDAIEFTADNGVLSVTPSALTCIDNTATVVAAGSGEWSAHADNPSETVIADAESNTTTISGFVASGTYRYDWTTQYCSSTIEVTFDNGNVPEPVTVTTIDYCVDEVATPLTATALANHTINWYTVATGGTAASTAPTPDTSINNVTIYYVSQLSDLNCESARVPVTVTVHEVPAAPTAAVTAVSYCEDATATALTANALTGNTLNWYTVATGGTASATAPIPVTDLPAGTITPVVTSYYVSQVSANSCESPRTEIVVTVNPSVVPVTDFTYPVASICVADTDPVAVPSTGYTAGGFYSGDAGLIINPATGEINLGASTPGLHTVTYTVNPNPADCNVGHSSNTQITITPLAVAETGFTFTTPICTGTANQTPVLNAGFITGGTFTADNAGLSINAATGEINVGASTAGTYVITYTVAENVANCVAAGSGNATIVITQQFTPVTGFDYDNSFCFGAADATPNLAANFTTGGTFTGTNGLVIDAATGTVNVAASTSGEHTVTYTFAGDTVNCISQGTFSYTFTIGSELAFDIDGNCEGSSFIITGTPENGGFSDNASFEWTVASGATVGTNDNAFNVSNYLTSTPETDKFPIEFFLTVTVDGCETTRSYTVEGITCTIQKGISPNNDNMNDSFDLQYMGVKKLEIFNRYGQEVYSKTNYKNEWIGQGSNGDELPTGTYYYVIERSAGGTNTGWIYINRQE